MNPPNHKPYKTLHPTPSAGSVKPCPRRCRYVGGVVDGTVLSIASAGAHLVVGTNNSFSFSKDDGSFHRVGAYVLQTKPRPRCVFVTTFVQVRRPQHEQRLRPRCSLHRRRNPNIRRCVHPPLTSKPLLRSNARHFCRYIFRRRRRPLPAVVAPGFTCHAHIHPIVFCDM